jgi:putative DNA primase/helicase
MSAAGQKKNEEASTTPQKGWRASVACAASIIIQAVHWLWLSWVARGKLTILAGQAGAGKTTVALGVAATVSRGGTWPDGGAAAPGNVIIWSGEDDTADVLVPRLAAMDADLSRIFVVQACTDENGKRRPFDPSRDMELLSTKVGEIGDVSLIILDPIVSAVRGDMNQANAVRGGLQEIVDLAAAINAAVIGITHFSKGSHGVNPVDRVIGSQAFGALARTVLVAARDEAGNGVLARAKSNLALCNGGIAYRIDEAMLPGGIQTTRVVWGEAVIGAARDILAAIEGTEAKEPPRKGEAKAFLREVLGDGPVPSTRLFEEARRAGHSDATIRRAQDALGIKPRRMGKAWSWDLSSSGEGSGEEPSSLQVEVEI